MIKYYTFYRENNKFDDILKDPTIKKLINIKVVWYQYLMIGINELNNDHAFSYIALKYGDEITTLGTRDFTPVPGVDYIPKKTRA